MTIKNLNSAATELSGALGDRIILADDSRYDLARRAWNLAIDQRPFAVASPESAEDVVDIVRAAAATGLRVAPQSTGHGAGALADTDLSSAVLVSLARMRGATVDPEARTALVLGGSQWNDVLEAAAPFGLTALHGSAGDVGVVGYALNGGVSFYARAHGLAVNSVRAVQLVTAEGRIVRASAQENAELFWAVRGGSGAFGVVVSLEIDLLPLADVFAGMLLFDGSRAAEVSRTWAAWTSSAPESVSTSLRVMHVPPLPELPPFLSGRSLVIIDGAILETDAVATTILEPLRALGAEMDTFARIPSVALVHMHMDPPEPSPACGAAAMLSGIPSDAVDAFLAASQTPGLMIAELRHLGGAAARRPEHGGAVASVGGDYVLNGIAMVPSPDFAEGAYAAVHGLVAALEPWHADAMALTFIDGGGVDRARGFGDAAVRLRELKAVYDPADVFAAAQPVS